jgi:hypothetical protein
MLKRISITYSACVFVSLVIQHAKHMPHIILSSVVCPALQYISTVYHKRHDFWKEKLLNIKYVLVFSTIFFSEIFVSSRRIQRASIINVHKSSCKAPLIFIKF